MAESSTHIIYSFEDIQRYLQGKMSATEMHAIEKAALQDPFLADAIEGYREASSTTAQQHLNEINAALQQEEKSSKVISIKKNFLWLHIAAIVILLAGAGVTGTYFFKTSGNQQQIAQVKKEAANKHIATKDSIATTKTRSSNNNAAKIIAQTNKPKKIQSIKKEKVKASNNADTLIKEETSTVSIMNAPAVKIDEAARFSPSKSFKKNDSFQTHFSNISNEENTKIFAGKVIDENRKPVPNVMVETSDKQNAVFTDINGNFTLHKNDSFLTVTATSVGYTTKSVFLKPQDSNTITLNANESALNDVVVTGYGIKKSKSAKQNAMPVGGWINFNNYVMSRLNKDSTNTNYTLNTVELEFLIDDAGNPYNISIIKSLDYESNLKAIDILKSGPKWTSTSKNKKATVAIAF